MTDLRKQLEFYFSNQNYHKDTYLRTTCEENEGIPIEKILKFKKLQPCNYSEDDIKEALKDSKIVKVNGEKLIKVHDTSYDEYVTRKHTDYTVVIGGIDKDLSLEEIESGLCKYFVPKLIRMMKNGKRKFLGIVKVELESVEEVERVLKMDIPAFGKKDIEEKTGEGSKDDLDVVEKDDVPKNKKIETEDTENVADDHESGEDKKKNTESKEEPAQAESGATKKKKDDESVKKIKRNLLKIYTEEDYQKMKGSNGSSTEKRDEFLVKNKDKLYKFISDKEWTIKDMKDAVKNVVFVDLDKKVLRFKDAPEEESTKINDELEILRMRDEECKEYADGIKFGDQKKSRKRKMRS
ncbi:hypothetical protein VCUG_01416 [Vavraia culicis subsp. floridensis]|uniref:HTH La-type RNA-binding domain-containing protein n=1 Tax=Vavraia culicis (isolate floridensis) TaxID=948595 RepID=L2GVD2_VAVCU|nr:uncharacterized protein VCUG_01416 [Vavraia culicis subsp. floridensis]ELA47055.1 hypothetical protein VCUG_01416 [Vavraia culicis subsp. floridensis]